MVTKKQVFRCPLRILKHAASKDSLSVIKLRPIPRKGITSNQDYGGGCALI